jgi:iron complex outermembrane receptor protein
MKYFVLMALVGVIFTRASAQDGSCTVLLQGLVSEQKTAAPLEFAHVRVLANGAEFQTASDEEGQYQLQLPCADSIVIYVSFLGYETLRLQTAGSKNLDLEHQLVLSKYFFAPVLVSEAKSAEIKTMERVELSTISATSARDFSAISAALPAIRRKSSGSNTGKPLVRAYSGSRLQLGVDGVPLYAQQWGEEHAPELFPGFYDELVLLDEVSALQLSSEGVGGALLLKKKAFEGDGQLHLNFELSASDQDRRGGAFLAMHQSHEKSKISWRLQGFTSKGGDIRTPLGTLRNTGSENVHWSYDLQFAPKKRTFALHYAQFQSDLGIFQGAHIGNLSDLNAAIESDELRVQAPFSYGLDLPRQEVLHDFLQFKYEEHRFFNGSLLFRLGRQFNQRQEFDAIRGNTDGSASMELNKTTWNSELTWHRSEGRNEWRIGTQAFTTKNTNGAIVFIPNHREERLASFVQHAYAWDKKWKLKSILRWDVLRRTLFLLENDQFQQLEQDRSSLNAALVLENKISKEAQWQLEISTLGRVPSVNELFASGLHHGAAALEYGDPDLQTERAYKIQWQGSKTFDRLKVQFNTFFHRIDNYVFLDPRSQPVLTIRGAFPVFDQRQTNANFYGGEAIVNYYLNALQVGQSLSFVRAEKAKGGALPQIPPFQHTLFVKHERKTNKWGLLSFAVEHQFTAEQHHFDETLEVSLPPKAVHLFTFRASSKFKVKKSDFSIGFELWNLFDVKYWDYLNRQRFFAPEPGRTLNINLKYRFN